MDIVQEIKNNVGIKELSNSLRIRQSGNMYYCINPMHHDDTPSMKLYPDTNSFHCFGCNTGGDIIKFYELCNGVDFKTAVKELAIYSGLRSVSDFILETDKTYKTSKKPIRIRTEIRRKEASKHFLCEYDAYYFDERSGIVEYDGNSNREYAERLALAQVRSERIQRNVIIFNELYEYCNESGLDDKAFNYLITQRKLSESLIIKNKLFTLNDIPAITKHLTSLFDVKELIGAGLFKHNDKTGKDELLFKETHRLIIPYLDGDNIIYLRGRYFDKNGNTQTDRLKYYGLLNDCLDLNTVKRFYNLDTLTHLPEYSKIYLTEGELDCLTAETLELNSIAIPGVSSIPTDTAIKKLSSYHVVILFDNDDAGRSATETFTKKFRDMNIDYSTITLPEGIKDVNEFLINELNENLNNNKND